MYAVCVGVHTHSALVEVNSVELVRSFHIYMDPWDQPRSSGLPASTFTDEIPWGPTAQQMHV